MRHNTHSLTHSEVCLMWPCKLFQLVLVNLVNIPWYRIWTKSVISFMSYRPNKLIWCMKCNEKQTNTYLRMIIIVITIYVVIYYNVRQQKLLQFASVFIKFTFLLQLMSGLLSCTSSIAICVCITIYVVTTTTQPEKKKNTLSYWVLKHWNYNNCWCSIRI